MTSVLQRGSDHQEELDDKRDGDGAGQRRPEGDRIGHTGQPRNALRSYIGAVFLEFEYLLNISFFLRV